MDSVGGAVSHGGYGYRPGWPWCGERVAGQISDAGMTVIRIKDDRVGRGYWVRLPAPPVRLAELLASQLDGSLKAEGDRALVYAVTYHATHSSPTTSRGGRPGDFHLQLQRSRVRLRHQQKIAVSGGAAGTLTQPSATQYSLAVIGPTPASMAAAGAVQTSPATLAGRPAARPTTPRFPSDNFRPDVTVTDSSRAGSWPGHLHRWTFSESSTASTPASLGSDGGTLGSLTQVNAYDLLPVVATSIGQRQRYWPSRSLPPASADWPAPAFRLHSACQSASQASITPYAVATPRRRRSSLTTSLARPRAAR